MAYDVKEATRYLETGGLGEVYGLADMARQIGEPKVQLDTDMAIALCRLAGRATRLSSVDAPGGKPAVPDALSRDSLARGLNVWMDRYIADSQGFEAQFRTIQRHLAEQSEGIEPTYGEVGADYLVQLLAESA
jgi:hypothetical protein